VKVAGKQLQHTSLSFFSVVNEMAYTSFPHFGREMSHVLATPRIIKSIDAADVIDFFEKEN